MHLSFALLAFPLFLSNVFFLKIKKWRNGTEFSDSPVWRKASSPVPERSKSRGHHYKVDTCGSGCYSWKTVPVCCMIISPEISLKLTLFLLPTECDLNVRAQGRANPNGSALDILRSCKLEGFTFNSSSIDTRIFSPFGGVYG